MVADLSLETKIWGIYRGLTIILEKGLTSIQIESDSQNAVLLFNEEASTNHPQSNIINDGRYLLNCSGITLIHIYHNANQCDDHLAHLGAKQDDDLFFLVKKMMILLLSLIPRCL